MFISATRTKLDRFVNRIFITGLASTACVSAFSSGLSRLHTLTCPRSSLLVEKFETAIGSSLSSRSLCFSGTGGSSEDSDEMESRPPKVIPANKQHKATMIFLHGLGDQGDGWAEVFHHEIRNGNIKYICPHSASRPVTLNLGMNMPAWYDLFGLDKDMREDDSGIEAAAKYVHGLIDAEVATGVPANKIVVGGFSMGGALAIYAGLTYPQKLGAIVGLSSFFLQRNRMPGNHTANLTTPIFLAHGTVDFLVPLAIGNMSKGIIEKFNPNVEMHTYNMAHTSCGEELRDLKKYIEEKLSL